MYQEVIICPLARRVKFNKLKDAAFSPKQMKMPKSGRLTSQISDPRLQHTTEAQHIPFSSGSSKALVGAGNPQQWTFLHSGITFVSSSMYTFPQWLL